jgi:hypothetical protein
MRVPTRFKSSKHSTPGGYHILGTTYRAGAVAKIAKDIGIDTCPKQPEKDRKVRSYHGRILLDIICHDCGLQHNKQVVEGQCVDQKKCLDRQRKWQ